MVEFYRGAEVDPVTKFIAAMIWGHEAPLGGRRDNRGPWKLSQMFAEPSKSENAIRSVSVESPEEITEAYRLLDITLKECGPNFFTKHFYFIGKAQAQNKNSYPLIFDDRVANGLIKLAISNYSTLGIVRVSALRTPKAYLQYLDFARQEADRIKCGLDKIEYYLFNL